MKNGNQDFYRKATGLLQAGDLQAAIDQLTAWLGKNPDDETAKSLLGSAFLRAARADDAIAAFTRATSDHPQSYAAWGDLAFAHMTLGRDTDAIAAFEAAVRLNPGFYPAWCFLAKLRYSSGDVIKAVECLAKADACDPMAQDFKALQAAMARGDFAEAEKIARSMLARQAGHPKGAYALAHLAGKVGAHEESVKILRYALEHFPADIIIRRALVTELEEIGDYATADIEAARAAALAPDDWRSWFILGRIRGHYGRFDGSLEVYDRALACPDVTDEDRGRIDLLRGHMFKILGQREASLKAYRSSIARVPNNGAAWWAMADMKTLKFDENDKAAMASLIQAKGIEPAQAAQAAFALAKAHEDAEEWDLAFKRYQEANRLRPDISFDPDAMDRTMDDFAEVFSESSVAVQAARDDTAPRPIFIVGLPRSGSTLIEQILSSHSAVEGTMELFCLPNLIRRIGMASRSKSMAYPQSINSFGPAELAEFGRSYISESSIYRQGKPYFIDKLPPNFQHVGLIHKILPQAIVIDARRNPLDTGFSAFKQHFAGGHDFSYDLTHIGRYYNAYLRIMDHWDDVLPGYVHHQSYEAMIADTEGETRAILAHCGLEFEDACLRFFENTRAVRTASSEQVRRPIYKSGIGYWRHFREGLEPLRQTLGQATLSRFGDSVA